MNKKERIVVYMYYAACLVKPPALYWKTGGEQMEYQAIAFEDALRINKIYSIHYFEYQKNFAFDGECHDFWELIYADKGEVIISGGSSQFVLKKGQMAFHAPGEFHNVTANGTVAPNLVVISFSCEGKELTLLRGLVVDAGETEQALLGAIIAQARQCFACRMDDPYLKHMPFREEIPYGAGQLIRSWIEELLIRIIRSELAGQHGTSVGRTKLQERTGMDMTERVEEYLKLHIGESLTLQKICRDNLISRTQLERLMKRRHQLGVMQYFSWLKIETARELIRMEEQNFTQIAQALGYRSVNYFSRQFKQLTGMTPTEYATSVKAITEASARMRS